jgi:hypothetical protein
VSWRVRLYLDVALLAALPVTLAGLVGALLLLGV